MMNKNDFFNKFKVEVFVDLGVAGRSDILLPKEYKDIIWEFITNNKVNLDKINKLSDDFELTSDNGITFRFIRKEVKKVK